MHSQNHEFWYRVHLAIKNFNHRFQIWRWLILILLSCCLFVCTYYTVKVKTSNISNMKNRTNRHRMYRSRKQKSLPECASPFLRHSGNVRQNRKPRNRKRSRRRKRKSRDTGKESRRYESKI